jgi:predicted transcriptional regulator
MKIKYLLCPDVLVCQPGDSLATTARRMYAGRVQVVAVCIDEDPVGVISESRQPGPRTRTDRRSTARAGARLHDPDHAHR